MRILWICGLPVQVQREALRNQPLGAHAAWSWVLGHLPPPQGVDLHIACPVTKGGWNSPEFNYRGATFHLVRCLPGRLQTGFLFDPFMVLPLYRKLRPTIVHGWGTEDSCSITARFLAPKTHVVQVQGLINAYLPHLGVSTKLRYVAWRERLTLRKARNVFVESAYSREISEPFCGRNTVIHEVDHPLRSQFLDAAIPEDPLDQMLFLGSLSDRKGYLDAVQAFRKAQTADWSLLMIGAGSADAVEKLTHAIQTSGKPSKISHIPHASSDEIVEHMARSQIFLLPSYMDTGPTALKEALAMGLWPICYNNSGPKEYINRFHFGCLAETGDIDGMATLLEQSMLEKPWEHKAVRLSMINEVRHALCSDTIWKQLLSIYDRIKTEIEE